MSLEKSEKAYHIITCGTSILTNLRKENPLYKNQEILGTIDIDFTKIGEDEYIKEISENFYYGIIISDDSGLPLLVCENSKDCLYKILKPPKNDYFSLESITPLINAMIKSSLNFSIEGVKSFNLQGTNILLNSIEYKELTYTIFTSSNFYPELVKKEFLELFDSFSNRFADKIETFKETGKNDGLTDFNPIAKAKIFEILKKYLKILQLYKLDLYKLDYSEGLMKFATDQIMIQPRKYSAELNAMWEFLANNTIEGCIFLTTDTKEGEFCGNVLAYYINNKLGIPVQIVRIKNFGKENFVDGITKLRSKTIKIVKSLQEKKPEIDIYFNITGGFKPVFAMMLFLGSILQIKSYYIHETTRKVVIIPSFPVGPYAPKIYEFLVKYSDEVFDEESEFLVFKRIFNEIYEMSNNMGYIQEKTDISENSTKYYFITTPMGDYFLNMYDDIERMNKFETVDD